MRADLHLSPNSLDSFGLAVIAREKKRTIIVPSEAIAILIIRQLHLLGVK